MESTTKTYIVTDRFEIDSDGLKTTDYAEALAYFEGCDPRADWICGFMTSNRLHKSDREWVFYSYDADEDGWAVDNRIDVIGTKSYGYEDYMREGEDA